jgi:O-methyltransferase involved in polyketide biosynthesis
MRDSGAILADQELARLIDIAEPVCVLLSGVLHFLEATQAREVARTITRAIAPGSYVIISVGTGEDEVATPFRAAYTAASLYIHSADEIRTFFDGLELVPPGLVPGRGWQGGAQRKQLPARRPTFLAGVGRKKR